MERENFNFDLFKNYQSFEALGVGGIRDTASRLKEYRLEEFCSKESDVLDIGSCQGAFVFALSPLVRSATGIEVHRPFYDEAVRYQEQFNASNTKFINAPFSCGLFDAERFDLILALAVHYWMPDCVQFVRDCLSLLRPGGVLVIESHNLLRDWHRKDWEAIRGVLSECEQVCGGRSVEKLTYKDLPEEVQEREFVGVMWRREG